MNGILFYILIGGGLGALLGACNKRARGGRPTTADWKRGALYGSTLAAVLYVATGSIGNSAAMNRSTANVTHITDTNFDAAVRGTSQPVVVDCYATWCGPCRELAPTVDRLADEYAGKIKFFKVNVDESPQVAQQFQVEAIPMLLFFKDGKLADTSVGLITKAELAGRLEALLATNLPPSVPER